jgi:hypothetical protein
MLVGSVVFQDSGGWENDAVAVARGENAGGDDAE